jgi:hypothetical protein
MMRQGGWDPNLVPPPGLAAHQFLPDEQVFAEDDLTEAVATGKRCEYQDIYRVPTDQDPNRYVWVDEKPLVYGATGDRLRTKKAREAFAVNVYHRFDEITDKWNIHEVRVNSTLLHTALEKILEGYPGLTQHEMKSFSPPFLPFIHRWEAMLSFMNEADPESETKRHLELLQDVLEPLLKESFEKIRDAKTTGHVAFKDLNLILIPGTMVLDQKTDSVGMMRHCHLGCLPPPAQKAFWVVGVDVVDWDGRRCGLLAQSKHVLQYQGLRALTALDVSPLEGLPDQENIRERLTRRGRKSYLCTKSCDTCADFIHQFVGTFEGLRGHFFKAFTDQQEERVNERMVADARVYHKYESAFPEYAKLSEIGQLTWAQSMNRYSSSVPSAPGAPIELDLSPMTDDECLLAVHYVKCFDIERKKWERLDVTKIHEIPWAKHAFNSLVLDQNEKDLVLALVDRDQFKHGKPFDDFVVGKGQGMIMLLCGPP